MEKPHGMRRTKLLTHDRAGALARAGVKVSLALLMAIALVGQSLTGAVGAEENTVSRARAVGIALDHVKSSSPDLSLDSRDLSELVVTDAYRSRHNGVTHVYVSQRLRGLDVAGSAMTLNITSDGRVLHVGSRLLSDLHARASGRARLDAVGAVRSAAKHLGLQPVDLHVVKESAGTDRGTVVSPGGISLARIPAKLIYQPVADGSLRLAWDLEVQELSELHWWRMSVDAATGRIISQWDLVVHDNNKATNAAVGHPREIETLDGKPIGPPARARDGSSYRVFALPLESPNDGDRTLEKNPADRSASPNGWHDMDGDEGPESTRTLGNNAHAYIDYSGVGNQALPLTDAEGGPDLTFDFDLNMTLPPEVSRDAALTNLFYWNNVVHDVFFRYGFDERSGNFQMHNYTSRGKGGDSIQAEGQDGGGVNNANFATPEDGRRPRMQMYLWPNPGKLNLLDGDLDAGVITHEYAHGISNRLTGGPSKTDCLAAYEEREGEGWSDFLAIALTARRGDKGADPRGLGTYVLGQDDRQQKGIRPTPYSTDMKIGIATYNSIKGAAVPHGVGWVWASMLWEVYWNLVDKHGFNPNPYESWKTGGNNLAIQLVMDGMKFQPCKPGFVDARDAILAADKALTGGENQCPIWAGFAKRGLGYRASQGDPALRSDGKEDYKTHPNCR